MSDWDARLRRTLNPSEGAVGRTVAGANELAGRRRRLRPRAARAALATAIFAVAVLAAGWRLANRRPDATGGAASYTMVSIGQVVRVTDPAGDAWLRSGSSTEVSKGSIVIMTGGER